MWRYLNLARTQLLLLGLLPLIVGLAVGIPFGLRYDRDRTIRERGVVTPGTILNSHKGKNGLLAVHYRFQDSHGGFHEADGVLSPDWEETYKQVGEIFVIYHPNDPTFSLPGDAAKGRKEETFNLTFFVIGGVLALFGMAVWIFHLARLVYRIFLVYSGQWAFGQVNDWMGVMEGKDGMFTYYFVGNNGRWYQGHSDYLPYGVLQNWPKGTKLTIFFDPNNPNRNMPDIFHFREGGRG